MALAGAYLMLLEGWDRTRFEAEKARQRAARTAGDQDAVEAFGDWLRALSPYRRAWAWLSGFLGTT